MELQRFQDKIKLIISIILTWILWHVPRQLWRRYYQVANFTLNVQVQLFEQYFPCHFFLFGPCSSYLPWSLDVLPKWDLPNACPWLRFEGFRTCLFLFQAPAPLRSRIFQLVNGVNMAWTCNKVASTNFCNFSYLFTIWVCWYTNLKGSFYGTL